jgi:hypothetical protein
VNKIRTAKYIFLVAGIWGVLVLTPLYFLEERIGRDLPPPITHPEIYYAFIGVALAFQVLFLIISTDVVRYRPVMIAAMLEKFSAGIAGVVLYAMGRAPQQVMGGVILDLVFGFLFIYAYVITPKQP